MYRYKGNALVVLGDPIGDTKAFQSLLIDFYNYGEKLGYDIIFYQVSDRFMPLYHNFGNQFFKLGEDHYRFNSIYDIRKETSVVSEQHLINLMI